jgi:uncharacterized membrane protein YccC
VVGAVVGAVLVTLVPYGPLLLIVVALLAFFIPYGFSRNYGLFATFLTPLVVVLLDLLTRSGVQLVQIRLIDTLLGCGIVLVLGYAPWPSSWHAHVGPKFADAVEETAHYLRRAFAPDPTGRSALRRRAYRQLSDLRTVFQRAVSEPTAISRRATAWYPPVVGLERTIDAITMTVVTAQRGGATPSEAAVSQLADALDEIARAVRIGSPPRKRPLPTDSAARPIARNIQDELNLFGESAGLPV